MPFLLLPLLHLLLNLIVLYGTDRRYEEGALEAAIRPYLR